MKIYYAIEETPLGTAGSVKNAQQYLDEPFIVISGDAVTDINLQQVIDFHQAKKAEATLTLYRVPNPLEYGVIITDPGWQDHPVPGKAVVGRGDLGHGQHRHLCDRSRRCWT